MLKISEKKKRRDLIGLHLTRLPAASNPPLAGREWLAPSLCMEGGRQHVITGSTEALPTHKRDSKAFVGEQRSPPGIVLRAARPAGTFPGRCSGVEGPRGSAGCWGEGHKGSGPLFLYRRDPT